MRAVLLTGHFPRQKRRGSLLWISEHLQRQGWHVTHVTVGYSWLSRLKRDARLRSLDHAPRIGVEDLSPSLRAVYACPFVHPFRLGGDRFERLMDPVFDLFTRHWRPQLAPHLPGADLIICESGLPVLLAPILAELAPDAPRIYRVNDDIALLNAPKRLLQAEQDHAALFSRISTASPHLAAKFHGHRCITLDPMGIPKDRFFTVPKNPFTRRMSQKIAVCAGTTQLDVPAILRVADHNPNWELHILGRLRRAPPQHPRVIWHGEQSFETTLAHVAHADIGLAPYLDTPGVEYQATNSNRILLYRYVGLPVLGPDRLCHRDLPGVFGYSDPDAYARCEGYGRQPEPLPDWSELVQSLVQNGVTDPPSEVSITPERIVKSRVKTVPAFASNA